MWGYFLVFNKCFHAKNYCFQLKFVGNAQIIWRISRILLCFDQEFELFSLLNVANAPVCLLSTEKPNIRSDRVARGASEEEERQEAKRHSPLLTWCTQKCLCAAHRAAGTSITTPPCSQSCVALSLPAPEGVAHFVALQMTHISGYEL